MDQRERTFEFLVVHHSASPSDHTLEIIRRAHIDRGFDDIGYHYLINPAGTVFNGRDETLVGAHAYGLNRRSIGICLIGNFEEEPPAAEQLASLERLLAFLCDRHELTESSIIGHRDAIQFAPQATRTKCPGDVLYSLLANVRLAVAAIRRE